MTTTWNLHGCGRRDHDAWDHLHEITRDWTAAWAGIDGFHISRLPDRPPVTTHLWAWTTNTWLRVRVDGSHWWAALLTYGSSGESSFWSASEDVGEPTITSLRHWQSDDGQAKQFRPAEDNLEDIIDAHHRFIQLVPLRRTTGVFIGSTESHQQAA